MATIAIAVVLVALCKRFLFMRQLRPPQMAFKILLIRFLFPSSTLLARFTIELIKFFFCLKQLITFKHHKAQKTKKFENFSAEPVFSSFNIPFFNILLLTVVASIKLFLALCAFFNLCVFAARKKH